jgi:peptidoglycan biosynthesis protein MviN/MurJ (putative lipid II flippase)
VPLLTRVRRGDRKDRGRASTQTPRDAFALLVAYVKQETLDPLKGLGRFVIFGVAGSVAIAAGTVLLLLAALRILQTETGTFHGNLSWVPYLIVTVLGLVVIVLALWRIVGGPAARRTPAKKAGE